MSATQTASATARPLHYRSKPEIWYGAGIHKHPVGAGRLTGEELGSVDSLGGREDQGLAPRDFVNVSTKCECKPGLLVAVATVKGFDKPWSILIDSGASCNYVRRRSLEGSQRYAEALKAHEGDSITVRLATGMRVTVPKVPLNLGVKFLDFDSIERCLVLELDSRYDLILGMAWLERHEPWIDWRSKTLGATRNVPSEALASHEPTFARQQKRYWREPLTESVSVLDIGVSELMNSDVKDICETARTPLSDTHCDCESLNAESIVGLGPSHQGCIPSDARGVARINPPSEVGRDGASLDVGKDIVVETPRDPGLCPLDERVVTRKLSLSDGGCDSTSLDVGNDIVGGMPRDTGLCPMDVRDVTRKRLQSDVGEVAHHWMSIMTSALV